MVKKRTIGKIQLVLGIVILLIGIGGLVASYFIYNFGMEKANEINGQVYITDDNILKSLSNETKEIIYHNSYIGLIELSLQGIEVLILCFSFSIITIILSLILVLEGLANMGKEEITAGIGKWELK